MTKRKILVTLFLALSASCWGQNIEEVKKCVGFIFGDVHVKNSDGTLVKDEQGKLVVLEMPLGTAFLVSVPDKRGGDTYGFGYLVTAKHVLKDADDSFLRSVRVRLNLKSTDHNSNFGFAEIPVTNNTGQLLWFDDKEHPENDVALVPFMPDAEKVDYKFVPIGMFTDTELLKARNVSEGDSVYLVGLMPQYYGEKKNYPVVRRGSLALLTDELIQTGPNTKQQAYLAEMASWPGNSGAPVFLNLGGFRNGSIIAGVDLHLLGLMLGYFSNMRQAETVETRTIIGGDPSNIGISFILPAANIKRVLDSSPLQTLRDAAVQNVHGAPH